MVWVFVVYAAVLLGLSAAKSLGLGLPFIHALEVLAGGDKRLHFSLALGLGLLGQWTAWRVMRLSHASRIVVVLAMLALLLVADEGHQHFVAGRHFDWADTLWGCAGLLAGTGIFLIGLLIVGRPDRKV